MSDQLCAPAVLTPWAVRLAPSGHKAG